MISQIDDCRFQSLAPSKRQKMFSKVLAALYGHRDHVNGIVRVFVVRRFSKFVGCAAHDHQQIVEIMCHSASKLSDGLQPLRLPKGLRGSLACGYVNKSEKYGSETSRCPCGY